MDLSIILKKYYPQNSQGGECVAWVRNIFNQPAMGIDPNGNDINLKFKFVEANGCIAANIDETYKGFRIGDCIFTTEGASKNWLGQWKGRGHEAIITGFYQGNAVLAESNFDLDGKVKYGRLLSLTSPKIIGIYRPSFKIDLGLFPIPLAYNVFVNNAKWNNQVFIDTGKLIEQYSDGKLSVTMYPLNTQFKNWYYKVYEQMFNVIDKDYITEFVMPLAFTNNNKPANLTALIIKQAEWQGTIWNGVGTEIGYYHYGTNPGEIQIASDEQNLSPWYTGMPLVTHALIHENGHFLRYISGQTDTTHNYDNSVTKQLPLVYSDIDWNRVALNLC